VESDLGLDDFGNLVDCVALEGMEMGGRKGILEDWWEGGVREGLGIGKFYGSERGCMEDERISGFDSSLGGFCGY
jgi:hypothetical protein